MNKLCGLFSEVFEKVVPDYGVQRHVCNKRVHHIGSLFTGVTLGMWESPADIASQHLPGFFYANVCWCSAPHQHPYIRCQEIPAHRWLWDRGVSLQACFGMIAFAANGNKLSVGNFFRKDIFDYKIELSWSNAWKFLDKKKLENMEHFMIK